MNNSGRFLIALGALGALAPACGAHAAELETTAFEQLKQLEGTWRPADSADSPMRVSFELIARDTVLVETWKSPDHASMTVYHQDGERLLATHYCPRGNQPRMALTGRDEDDSLRFEFVDGTGLDEPGERYEHLLTLRTDASGALIRGEIYVGVGDVPEDLGAPAESRFVRVSDDAPAASTHESG